MWRSHCFPDGPKRCKRELRAQTAAAELSSSLARSYLSFVLDSRFTFNTTSAYGACQLDLTVLAPCEDAARTSRLSPSLKLFAVVIDPDNEADDGQLDTWSTCDAVALSHASSGGKTLLLGPGRFVNVSRPSPPIATNRADSEVFMQPESGVGTVRLRSGDEYQERQSRGRTLTSAASR